MGGEKNETVVVCVEIIVYPWILFICNLYMMCTFWGK